MTTVSATDQLVQIAKEKAMDRGFHISDLVAELQAEEPGLVKEWLDEAQSALLTAFLSDVFRWSRHAATTRQNHASRVESMFAQSFVLADNIRKPLGKMIGSDHVFVADQYSKDKRSAAFHESLHRQIAKRVGKRMTEEVFTEDEIRNLFSGGTGGSAAKDVA
jgi:hypothetical protein